RAAYVGGCTGTSNVLAGRRFGIPLKGTHAHSWVMSFEDEDEAFSAWADASPNNCVFLVDTYDSIAGVRKAIRAGERLRQRGFEMIGVRLDSGDLVALSRQARQMLDEAGFPEASVVASSDLDELRITRLKEAGAAIDVWGVGTRLATASGQSALGGVYKLSALRDPGGAWQSKVKLSEVAGKTSNPGMQQVRRFRSEERLMGDVIYDETLGIETPYRWVDGEGVEQHIGPHNAFEDLLQPVMQRGQRIAESPSVQTLRERALSQLDRLDPATTRLVEPEVYPVGLDPRLNRLKSDLIREIKR
ncbi:MAG: nicotinate phosphoribosyltransferase, partial [Acidobacteriota bacterium]